MHIGANLSLDQIPKSMRTNLTRKMILSQINGIYDPLGLATPFTMKAKLLMRQLRNVEGKGLDWYNDIPSKLKEDWICFFKALFDMERISFSRCIQPPEVSQDLSLIMFSDASEQALGTCAYVTWELPNGKFESKLIAAKGRAAHIKKWSVV